MTDTRHCIVSLFYNIVSLERVYLLVLNHELGTISLMVLPLTTVLDNITLYVSTVYN